MKKAVAVALIIFTLFVINVLAIGLLSHNSLTNIQQIKSNTATNAQSQSNSQTTTTNNQQTQTNNNANAQPVTPSQPQYVPIRVTRAS